ncbi:hypothetical protein PTSG_06079 [Salpingoeca rosetta]|uniref:PSMD12/CSN4-like N-terminal domain-containing protein n=1 Tax=Salpingoeca rosetta (strain ATCC 50818 / BSB-021) TaxID=946362 RepID=F2UDM3_SALR5|nr:uncharacterized protein PTSG_06079 [Salpingoeca rosetta]EGD74718.1 hypothetical protein PTSG_06079 [Salpingoeca rosetta]|eukprot:XP_004992975.1 hypothetical protein PTSG_06079 [Salpingoeca rosetta]
MADTQEEARLAGNAENQLALRASVRELGEQLSRAFSDQSTWDTILDIGEHALGVIQANLVSLDEQVAKLYEVVADVLEKREQWVAAAEKLASIPLESGQASFSAQYKLHIYLRIGALFLEDNDPYRAESYVLRAAGLVGSLNLTDKADPNLLKYKVQCARIDDAKRRFSEAAQRYIELAYMIPDDEARMMALSQAVNCAVLSPPGTWL